MVKEEAQEEEEEKEDEEDGPAISVANGDFRLNITI